MTPLTLHIPGTAVPQGSKRYVGQRQGRAILIESSKRLPAWRELVATLTRIEVTRQRWTPPDVAHVTILAELPRPKSHLSARGGLRPSAPEYPTTYPDVDKLARALLDGLAAGGALSNDSTVVRITAEKSYAAGTPVTHIWITPLEES